MTQTEMVNLLTTKIETKISQAGKTADWQITKSSVIKPMTDGIVEAIAEISVSIQNSMVEREKINELIKYINMLTRIISTANPTTLVTPQQPDTNYPIKAI